MMNQEDKARAEKIFSQIDAYRLELAEINGKPMSEMQLVNQFFSISTTTYNRLKNGVYTGSVAANLDKLDRELEDMAQRIADIQRRSTKAGEFVRTRFGAAVVGAVVGARDDANCCRIVIGLAPTGGGKTATAQYLAARYSAIAVEGRQSWRTSYKAFCADVAAAAGSRIRQRKYDEHLAEEEMLGALGQKAGILVIDEAVNFGRGTWNAIKLIANRTDYTVVILSIPELFDELRKGAENEIRQILNRCQAVLRFDGIPAHDVDQFVALSKIGPDSARYAKLIIEAANYFGAYKLVRRIAVEQQANGGEMNEDDLKKAIARAKVMVDERDGKERKA
jgi:hypothetical protein